MNISGIKRADDKFYALIDNGEKLVSDEMFSDARDVVTSTKAVADCQWVEVSQADAVRVVNVARDNNLLPASLPSNTDVIWIIRFLAVVNEVELLQAQLEEARAAHIEEVDMLNERLDALKEAHFQTVQMMNAEIEGLNAKLDEVGYYEADNPVSHLY